MKKKLAMLLAAVMVLSSLAACGGSKKEETKAPETKAETKAEETKAEETKAEETKGADAAEHSGSVTLYSTMSTEWADPIIAGFEEKYGITVDVINAGTSELTARIQAESENVQCDVFWGSDRGVSAEFADKYLESYVSTEDAAYADAYKDEVNHKWYGQHLDANIAIYNKDLVSDDEAPKSWDDLCSEDWKGKIYLPDPTTSGTGLNLVYSLMFSKGTTDEERYEWLEKFAKNLDGVVASGSSVAYKGCIDGEYPIGMTYEEAAYRSISEGANIGVVYMEEGVNLAVTSVQICKNAPHMENAKLLEDYLLSYEVQEYMTTIFRRSPRNDMPPTEGVPALSEVKFLDEFDADWIAENSDKILESWKDALYE